MLDDVPKKDQPTATGPEWVLVGPAVAVAKHIHDSWKDGRPAIEPSDPLMFAVVNTETDDSGHTLTLECTNLGDHGVYLEHVEVAEPKGIEASTQVEVKSKSFGPVSDEEKCLPVHLLPGKKGVLHVNLSTLPADRLSKKPYGHLSVAYTVAGVAKSDLRKKVGFSVRPGA